MGDHAAWQAEGELSFTSFVTRLLRTDQSVMEEPGFPFERDGPLSTVFWMMARNGASEGTDSTFALPLPPNLGRATRARLFHERMHFAGLMSYPLLQLHAIHEFEDLRINIGSLGGNPAFVVGETQWDTAADPLVLRDAKEHTQALISGKARPTSTDVMMLPGITDAGILTVNMSTGARSTPGFAGLLSFEDSFLTVPFNAISLLESSAHVSQFMFEGREVPRLREPGSTVDQRYLGCWEVWCRLHEPRYASHEDLAIAFLAAVDLALGAHALALQDSRMDDCLQDPWRSVQMRLVHARFGAIAMVTEQLPSPAGPERSQRIASIDEFQKAACLRLGWAPPNRSYAVMAAFLTQRLVFGSYWSFARDLSIDTDILDWALNASLGEIADTLGRLAPVWQVLSQSFHSTPNQAAANGVFGARLISKMINAAYFRSMNPPSTAAPHLDPAGLSARFKLPCIRLGSQYYSDTEFMGKYDPTVEGSELGALADDPIPIPSIDVLPDCLGLAALGPLREATHDCGLIDEVTREPNCIYVAGGAGCPVVGLSDDEEKARSRDDVDDWCHWTHATLRVGVARAEDRDRWAERWQRQGAPTDESSPG